MNAQILKIEAYLDQELSKKETLEFEQELQSNEQLQILLEERKDQNQIIGGHFRLDVENADAEIDFDYYSSRIMNRIEEAENSVSLEAKSKQAEPSRDGLFSWIKLHPAFSLTFAAATAVLLVFSMPSLETGPNPDDCVVDDVVRSKSTRVAVLQAENKQTGQKMTVIDIFEHADKGTAADKQQHPEKKIQIPSTNKSKPLNIRKAHQEK